ncbi:predicted protein [Naegleria gruberi]|uniref:Predicted protein n=1 Tax=Naegleria gruberi TaxID=5762 RepID=D2VCF0_NAEGR|nr:uncharacterized protein NAEGRDRAFT_48410 [Naegleria gruberi]EFC45294.1 predicted protein [Naegleria gruberi]|eukprot:XP_002678038.1 predicted protein [Naegleria gruberi strain NEG-M]
MKTLLFIAICLLITWLTFIKANNVVINNNQENAAPTEALKQKRGNPMPYYSQRPHTDCYTYKHGKPCPKPSPSPLPSFGIPGGSSPIDVYVPTSASCANAFASISSYTFESGNLVQYRQCRSLVLCLQRWVEQLLQLILAGLTPGATFSNTLSSVVVELNTAFGYVNSNLGGILSESGTTVNPVTPPNSPCTLEFAPVLAANGLVYPNECSARVAGAPNPYVNVTLNEGATASAGAYSLSDVTNPRIALTVLYTKYVVKILGFIQTYLNECVLSTESRVFTSGISSLNTAIGLIWSGDYNAAKNLVLDLSRNV